MALENLEPATRIESILDGEDIAPATRLEYFLKKAGEGGGGGGSTFVINVGLDENMQPIYLDRSYNDINTAITSGQAIQVRAGFDGNAVFYFLLSVSSNPSNGYTARLYDFTASNILTFDSETADEQLTIRK